MSEMKINTLQNKIDSIIRYLKPYNSLINCHMVEYITLDHWNKLLPRAIVNEVDEYGTDLACKAIWAARNEKFKPNSANEEKVGVYKNLSNFIRESDSLTLQPDDKICLSVDQLQIKLNSFGAEAVDSLKFKDFMSDKKSHEVEVLSSIVATLTNWTKSTHIVDVGGGKGFLAAMLVMLYNLKVLNIDCSHINEKGAIKRNAKLLKLWPGLLKKAEEIKLGEPTERKGRSRRNKNKNLNALEANKQSSFVESDEKEVQTLYCDKSKEDSLYRHVTEFVTKNTDFHQIIEDNFCYNKKDTKICFTGLHTCGDLGSTIVRLFQNCPSAAVLCGVPCCYHLLSESSVENAFSDLSINLSETNTDQGFPMSEYLRGVNIGRNARMLACQSVERVSANEELPSDSLFYRALLQVLIKSSGHDAPTGKMKKVGDSCKSFIEYVNIATQKLHFDANTFRESSIKELEESHQIDRQRLNVFYHIRMSLAPLIESLIILDRLMFLKENGFDGKIGDSFVVKMFDPIISPRCFSIVAFRNQYQPI